MIKREVKTKEKMDWAKNDMKEKGVSDIIFLGRNGSI